MRKKYLFNIDKGKYEECKGNLEILKEFISKPILLIISLTLFSLLILMLIIFRNEDFSNSRVIKHQNQIIKNQYEILSKEIDSANKTLSTLQKRDEKIYRILFGAEPMSSDIRNAGTGGVNKYADLEAFTNNDLVVNNTKKLDNILKRANIQNKSYDELMNLAKSKQKMFLSLPLIQPISHDSMEVSSGWGFRIHPIYKIRMFHFGMDFVANTGTNVHTTGDGIVKNISKSAKYGNVIEIEHGYGYSTLYGHLSKFNVYVGQKVKRGDIIGFVGNTGISTGPHLHYEIHQDGKAIDPKYYFIDVTAKQYADMISISASIEQSLD